MATVVLERNFEEPVSDEMIDGMKQTAERCLEINDVVRERTYLSSDRKRFICIFQAEDVESVRRAMDSAGMSYDKVYVATWF